MLGVGEGGLAAVDRNGKVRDFVAGGGQTLAVNQDRVYVVALKAGVRMLRVDAAGKLSPIGTIKTRGAARDVAPEGTSLVWVAEDDQGVRLYDVHDPQVPTVITWLGGVVPAAIVRIGPARLYAGYGGKLALLDTVDLKMPRPLRIFPLKGTNPALGAMLLIGSRRYLRRDDSQRPYHEF